MGEFDNLCGRIEIKLSDELQSRMWQWMRGLQEHNNGKDEITLLEFVAALHIHDISDKDPFIARVASVLKLLYYDIDEKEFREMIKNRGSPSATPSDFLDIPSDDEEIFGVPATTEADNDVVFD